ESGAVRCWGDGSSGQLGYGNTENIGDDPDEMPPPDVPLDGVVTQVAAGINHSCALFENGNVACWGLGSYGALGYGDVESIGDNAGEMPPAVIDLGAKAKQISCGDNLTCVTLTSGNVRCWGLAGAAGAY